LLHEKYPKYHILFTTITITSAKHFAQLLPERAVHQFAPLDTPLAVRRFIKHWQPDLSFFVDSELWPNMLHELRRRDAKVVLLNGRISKKSMQKWRFAPNLCKQMLISFTFIFAKSEQDADNFKQLGGQEVLSYGNLKFASNPLPCDADNFNKLRQKLANRPLWMAASTHTGEEAMVANVAQKLLQKYPDLLTIIVPRHAVRGDEIASELRKDFNISQRSKAEDLSEMTDIYIADTMGELGLFYRLSDIAFIGGSLVPHGGQNPLEAARLGCALIYGSHMDNFLELCDILHKNDAAIMVNNAEELYQNVDTLLQNPHNVQIMADKSLAIVQQNQGVIDKIMQKIAPLLT
jgi:3-deoxy-D-manno-octulosonic-acid transferase